MGQKDLTQKNLEYYPDVFADIMNALLYEGKQVVQPAELQPAPTETIYHSKKGNLRNQFHDVSKYEMREGIIRLQYTIERAFILYSVQSCRKRLCATLMMPSCTYMICETCQRMQGNGFTVI